MDMFASLLCVFMDVRVQQACIGQHATSHLAKLSLAFTWAFHPVRMMINQFFPGHLSAYTCRVPTPEVFGISGKQTAKLFS